MIKQCPICKEDYLSPGRFVPVEDGLSLEICYSTTCALFAYMVREQDMDAQTDTKSTSADRVNDNGE